MDLCEFEASLVYKVSLRVVIPETLSQCKKKTKRIKCTGIELASCPEPLQRERLLRSKSRRLLGSRWFWSQAYRTGNLALPVVSKSLSLQEPRMSHPTNGANNAKAVGRIK